MMGKKFSNISKSLMYFLYFFTLLIFLANSVSAQESEKENLNVFSNWIEWSDGANMLIHHINKQAFDYLDIRDHEIAKLKTRADWENRQKKVKDILMKIVGPFPNKTPLNPKITGVVKKDGYRIEKVIYESMPNFYVTAGMFIPDNVTGKTPTIIHVSGHTDIAFRSEAYQLLILNLVKKGFIVFAIDPIGQGERFQYYDPQKKASIIGAGVSEHSYVGNQCFISGFSLARYFIWDVIRGIDYLLTRKEVDPERIGIAGRSGGGTQSAYVMAFDDRIKAAAPESYITGLRRLLEFIGAQDAEQNFYHGISSGITHADLIEVRAPKPTLIVTVTRDYFSIQGARETFKESMKAFESFGKPENLQMVEDDSVHASTRKNRETVYGFFQKIFNFPGSSIDEKVEMLKPEELNVTTTGQILNSLGGETVFSINKKETENLIEKLEDSRKNINEHISKVKQKSKELSGYITPKEVKEPIFRGRYRRMGYSVEMYALQGEGNYIVPLLLMVPEGGKKFPAMIYVHPKGKSAEASIGGQIEGLVRRGFIVAAPDVIGIGETKGKTGNADYGCILIGRSIVGIQAGDIVRVVSMLKNRSDVEIDKIGAIGIGETCPALLHAGVFEPSINKITLIGALISYRTIVMNKFYNFSFSCAVAGALTAYDLPDLIACFSPRKILFVELKNQMNESASTELVSSELEFPRSVYSLNKVSENLKIMDSVTYDDIDSIIKWWLE
jgi:dienelactone hydrolase